MLFLKVNNFFVKYLHYRNAQAVEPDLPFQRSRKLGVVRAW